VALLNCNAQVAKVAARANAEMTAALGKIYMLLDSNLRTRSAAHLLIRNTLRRGFTVSSLESVHFILQRYHPLITEQERHTDQS